MFIFPSQADHFFDVNKMVCAVPLKACSKADQVGVAECVTFATRNSSKSQEARELKSPYSNIRAITLKLRPRRGQQQLQITRPRRAFGAPFP